MNWNKIGNAWERVKEGAESAWDQVANRLGSSESEKGGVGERSRERLQGTPGPWARHGYEIHVAGPSPTLAALTAAGLGAGLMYMLDPQQGRRRRALARDQVVRALNVMDDAIGVLSRDMSNRARGVWAEASAMPGRLMGESTTDDVLIERVRATLGRWVSHPRGIEVSANNGCVVLKGRILAHQLDGLLRAVGGVPGVRSVDDDLDVYESSEAVPSLQGGRSRVGERFPLMRSNWSPTARLLVGSAGGALLLAGAERGGPTGLALVGAGAGMLARAATNIPIREWVERGDQASSSQTQTHHPRATAPEGEMIEHAAGI